jgi:hypothetical protein
LIIFIDQYWQWAATNNSLWVERGVFSRLVIKENSRLLEIVVAMASTQGISIRPALNRFSRSTSMKMPSRTRGGIIPRQTSPSLSKTFAPD